MTCSALMETRIHLFVQQASHLHCAITHAILSIKGASMATLHVDNVSKELYLQIQRLATTQGRSLNAQVVVLLTQALQQEKEKDRKLQTKTLASIRQRRFTAPKNSPSSLALLNEDRNR